MIKMGTCRHCGQVNLDHEFLTQKDANDYATSVCSCPTATRARRLEQKKEQVHAAIDAVFTENDGVSDFIETLHLVGDAIITGKIASTSITLVGAGKLTIAMSGKGKVKVSRSVTNKNELEV